MCLLYFKIHFCFILKIKTLIFFVVTLVSATNCQDNDGLEISFTISLIVFEI